MAEQTDSAGDPLAAVVGLGASAGGMAALKEFFPAMPRHAGIAFVVVMHLDPDSPNMLPDLLTGLTGFTVLEASENQAIEADHVYIIPPGKNLLLHEGRVRLEPRTSLLPTAIDAFFRSLAEDRQERAVAIVLSGGGSDGALGIREVKARGGLVLVQDPATAEHPEMPQSAIATEMVDFVLPPAEMPDFLLRYTKQPYVAAEPAHGPSGGAADFLQEVLSLVDQRIGHDFRSYKESTLRRRVWRRMSLRQMQQPMEYVQVLRDNPAELDALARDLVISVTYFFRDPEAWKVVEEQVLPELLAARRPDAPLRVWVPGCSTGEEAYSLAILLLEQIQAHGAHRKVQVFATDINEHALEKARSGVYPETIAADVSPERLRRFFIKEGINYRMSKKVRECVVFATHNIVSDPAFSRLDLISCRNLLIYLDQEAQRRVMPVFHYALREGGFLILGSAESLAHLERQFQAVSPKWRIFRRIGASRPDRPPPPFPLEPPGKIRVRPPVGLHPPARSLTEIAQQLALDRFGPASALLDRQYRVLVLSGPTDRFLRVPSGEIDVELLSMVREGLRAKVRSALHQAAKDGGEVAQAGRVKRNGDYYRVQIFVTPVNVPDFQEGLFLVTFHGGTEIQEPPAEPTSPTSTEEQYVRQLERELQETRLELNSTIEQLEGSNEELKASHEEAVSMNEELQSSNEELETSKEELQSLNEELTTLNNQLEEKVAQLEATTNDLDNLLTSTDIATLFLDTTFHIRQFTPAAVELFHLISSDVGRPIGHFAAQFSVADLLTDAKDVLDKLAPKDQQVQTQDGRWFIRRTLPYRTRDNRIEGVVVTFHDVSGLKRAEQAVRRTVERLELLAEVSSQLLASDRPQEIVDSLCRRVMEHLDCQVFFNYLLDEPQDKLRLNSYQGVPPETAALIEWLEYGSDVCGCTACDPAGIAASHAETTLQPRPEFVRRLGIGAYACRPLLNQGRVIGTLSFGSAKRGNFSEEDLGLIRAVADQVAIAMQRIGLMQSLQQRAAEAHSANVAKSQFLASMSHELRTPMNAVLGMTDLALSEELSPAVRDYIETVRESAGALLELLNDILDLSRIEAGRLRLESAPFRLRSLVDRTVKSLGIRAYEKSLELLYDVADDVPDYLAGDSLRLRQVLTNLVANALKFTHKGEITVRVAARSVTDREACLEFLVQDTGIGISPEDQQALFAPFPQPEAVRGQDRDGSGLGLSISARLVELMGGRIWVESQLGKGSAFRFTVCMGVAAEAAAEDKDNRRLLEAIPGVPALVVADNATSRTILEQTLLRWSMRAETAADVPEALTRIHQAVGKGQRFQVVIADAVLPEIDGFTLANWIKSGSLAGPMILMLSAVERHTMAARCQEAGVLCLQKPVAAGDLLLAIGRVLGISADPGPAEPRRVPDGDLPPPRRTLRILLAEDTLGSQKLIVYALGNRGHSVEVANNGVEAVELIQKHDFDLVLMDLQMPVMDGLDSTAAIRKLNDPQKARVPIIAMTAHAYKSDQERCLAAGMNAYISKPINRRELVVMVEQIAVTR
jgi:two-component system CheB/CheR fusion protein